jgi:hypothetical protein
MKRRFLLLVPWLVLPGILYAASYPSDDPGGGGGGGDPGVHTHTAADTTSGEFADARVGGAGEKDEVNPTLGTETVGNYVSSVTGDAEIVVGGTPGEGWTAALSIAAGLHRDAEVKDGDLCSFDDADSKFAAADLDTAMSEMDDANVAGPNASDGKLHWQQIIGMPAGFLDGTDDGSAGSVSSVTGSAGVTCSPTTGAVGCSADTAVVATLTGVQTFATGAKTFTARTIFTAPPRFGGAATDSAACTDNSVADSPDTGTIAWSTSSTSITILNSDPDGCNVTITDAGATTGDYLIIRSGILAGPLNFVHNGTGLAFADSVNWDNALVNLGEQAFFVHSSGAFRFAGGERLKSSWVADLFDPTVDNTFSGLQTFDTLLANTVATVPSPNPSVCLSDSTITGTTTGIPSAGELDLCMGVLATGARGNSNQLAEGWIDFRIGTTGPTAAGAPIRVYKDNQDNKRLELAAPVFTGPNDGTVGATYPRNETLTAVANTAPSSGSRLFEFGGTGPGEGGQFWRETMGQERLPSVNAQLIRVATEGVHNTTNTCFQVLSAGGVLGNCTSDVQLDSTTFPLAGPLHFSGAICGVGPNTALEAGESYSVVVDVYDGVVPGQGAGQTPAWTQTSSVKLIDQAVDADGDYMIKIPLDLDAGAIDDLLIAQFRITETGDGDNDSPSIISTCTFEVYSGGIPVN